MQHPTEEENVFFVCVQILQELPKKTYLQKKGDLLNRFNFEKWDLDTKKSGCCFFMYVEEGGGEDKNL